MRILQFNIQSLKKKGNKELLEIFMTNNRIDIAVLYETWLADNSCTSLKNYNFACRNRTDGFGGVGIYIKKDIRYAVSNLQTQNDTLAITTLNLRGNIDIIVNYSPPNMDIGDFAAEMRNIFNFANSRRNTTLICGDFNAKSNLWDPNCSDVKGILEDILTLSKFNCLNGWFSYVYTAKLSSFCLRRNFCIYNRKYD